MSSPIDAVGIVVATARGPRAQAIDIAREFMDAIERSDLAAATALLAPGFMLRAPGGAVFRELAEFAQFGRSRYLELRKTDRQFDASEAAAGVVVYAHGVLAGRWLDGSEFRDLRYVDRFLVRDARIVELQVLNELGEFRPR
jgi:ketosteroid isomerase-like protein